VALVKPEHDRLGIEEERKSSLYYSAVDDLQRGKIKENNATALE
jgi:hypothetical protein